MAASVDYHHTPSFTSSIPHRRPLPAGAHPQFPPVVVQPDQFSHARSRTLSSNVLPPSPYPQYTASMVPNVPPQSSNRRTLSNATTSTTASSNASLGTPPSNARPLSQAPSSYASSIRRSTSSRSGASQGPPGSYVALLRKQKATVWCDRAQHEDPRLLAQQRAAKMRAQAEMVGGAKSHLATGRNHNSGSGGITGVRSKIRHHGAVKASAYSGGLGTQGNLSGAGVPMRLSASEVDDEKNSENGEDVHERRYHQRNGSGRSSLGSNHRTQSGHFSVNGVVAPTPGMAIRTRGSNASTPPGTSPVDARRNSLPLSQHMPSSTPTSTAEETPMPDMYASSRADYFTQRGSNGGSGSNSGSSSEERFGDVSALHQYGGQAEQQQKKTSDELRRRGSVDDRTMTMSGVRLFVANPDMDSD
ncbi:hypothetical protein AAFC00_003317 [Neodothiora populina]|uniref:Uncharacterized protein n=1 Tax=Neodothiora populina TaxID=2781224 RepID=A0ABR3PA90_9PEZI